MGPLNAISTVFAKTFTFSGRASRSEYWWFFAFYFIGSIVCLAIDAAMVLPVVQALGPQAIEVISPLSFASIWFAIAMSIPYLSLSVRRLHDAGFSGFWTLLYFLPFGALVLLIMHALASQNTTTVHGTPAAQPKADAAGKAVPVDQHKRAMQGYALLFDKDKKPTAQQQAERKAEISDYYRSKVLKAAPQA